MLRTMPQRESRRKSGHQTTDTLELRPHLGAKAVSPVPRRGINANTFARVRHEIEAGDVAALLILVQDEAYDIRSMAANLLECVDPNAEGDVESQLKLETDNDRRSRLMDVQIAIHGIRAGGTSCR